MTHDADYYESLAAEDAERVVLLRRSGYEASARFVEARQREREAKARRLRRTQSARPAPSESEAPPRDTGD